MTTLEFVYSMIINQSVGAPVRAPNSNSVLSLPALTALLQCDYCVNPAPGSFFLANTLQLGSIAWRYLASPLLLLMAHRRVHTPAPSRDSLTAPLLMNIPDYPSTISTHRHSHSHALPKRRHSRLRCSRGGRCLPPFFLWRHRLRLLRLDRLPCSFVLVLLYVFNRP